MPRGQLSESAFATTSEYGRKGGESHSRVRVHVTIRQICHNYLENKNVNRMVWPAQSPDLNPIENLWKYIKDIISKRKHRVKSAKEMRIVLTEVWPCIDKNFLLKLCNSVPKR